MKLFNTQAVNIQELKVLSVLTLKFFMTGHLEAIFKIYTRVFKLFFRLTCFFFLFP